MPLIDCRDCGGKVSDSAPACIHCGCPISKPAASQAPEAITQAGFKRDTNPAPRSVPKFRCAYCESAEVKVLPLVVADGTLSINTKTGTVGLGLAGGTIGVGGASSTTTGTHQSDLARMVSKPAPVESDTNAIGGGCLIFVVLFVLVALSDMPQGSGPMILLLGAVVVGVIQKNANKAAAAINAREYPPRLAKWQRSFLCMRCMRVTDPGA